MAGVPVYCHALGGPGLLTAVRAGVDTIEHGGWLDDACIEEMVRAPDLVRADLRRLPLARHAGPALQADRARGHEPAPHRELPPALQAGVGSRWAPTLGGYGYGDNGLEPVLMVEAGMTPAQAIEVSTAALGGVHGHRRRGSARSPPARRPTSSSSTRTRSPTSACCARRSTGARDEGRRRLRWYLETALG